MMLRNANNEYINIEDVDVERQAKLFQNIGDTAGDFSYSFSIDNNSEVRNILGIPSPVDGFNKSIYTANDIDLCNDEGGVIYKGFLRITDIQDDAIEASFFSGNNNWFNLMSGDIADLDLDTYEEDINTTTIPASWNRTSGIIYPFVDLGSISKRSTNNWKLDDFQPFMYVKDAVKECFKYSGLKLSGEILNDWRYNHLITTNGSVNTDELAERKALVSKSTTQTIAALTTETITFNVFTGIYFPGLLWDTGNHRYVADSKMILDLSFTSLVNVAIPGVGINILALQIYINGSLYKVMKNVYQAVADQVVTFNDTLSLDSGDILTIVGSNLLASSDIKTAKLTLEPSKLYRVFARNILPNINQVEFVNNVFKLFNTVIDYDQFTKTVSVDLFKNVIRNDEIDLSEYIDPSTVRENYTEILESYGRINVLKYGDPSSEDIDKYNIDKVLPYGAGEIESNNDFIDPRVDILESIFCASDMSFKNPFSINLPRFDFNEEDEDSEVTATITDDGGSSRFTVPTTFKPVVGDIINIKSSTNDVYSGQYFISALDSAITFNVFGLPFASAETVTIARVTINKINNSDQILLLVEPQVPYSEFAPDFSSIDLEDANPFEDPAIAWFYRPMDGNTIDQLDRSLSFDPIPIENPYQRTMINDYWGDLGPILQDPIKIYVDAYLPKSVFESINFKQPIRIKTDKFNSRFFPNRITGYKDSSQPCTLELIKLP